MLAEFPPASDSVYKILVQLYHTGFLFSPNVAEEVKFCRATNRYSSEPRLPVIEISFCVRRDWFR